MSKVIGWSASGIALVVLLTQAAYWVAARPPAAPFEGSCAVLVLGYPARNDGAPGPVQRFRVEAGVRAYRENRCSKLVLSGGAIRNEFVEAESMGALARSLGVDPADVVLEPKASTTWENVGCSARYTRTEDRVLVVSDSLHARRAVRYACRQDPQGCGKYRPAGARPPVEFLWWSVPGALYELRAFLRDFLVFERDSAANAPPCGAGTRRPPVGNGRVVAPGTTAAAP